MKRRNRILIVDDHALVRRTLRDFIDGDPDFQVCADVGNPDAALAAIRGKQPDLALVDLCLGKENGLNLTRQIHADFPGLPVVVLTMHSREIYQSSARRAGASGYVLKSEAPDGLLPAMRKVLARPLTRAGSAKSEIRNPKQIRMQEQATA